MATTEREEQYQLAKNKAARYCSYQERSIAEVEAKLLDWGIETDADRKKIIQELQTSNFLDEQRYIATFVRGRFNQKQWGKRKIYYELVKKKIDPALIQAELDRIDETAYLETLKTLVAKKRKQLPQTQPVLMRQKITAYLLQKGYEFDLIQQVTRQV